MEAYFSVTFEIRKGLGPDTFLKTIGVMLDDIDPSTTDAELFQMAILEAEQNLYKSEDYHYYGKNWHFADIEQS
jgi:hypothetical protein